jgi:hypothetical protein
MIRVKQKEWGGSGHAQFKALKNTMRNLMVAGAELQSP